MKLEQRINENNEIYQKNVDDTLKKLEDERLESEAKIIADELDEQYQTIVQRDKHAETEKKISSKQMNGNKQKALELVTYFTEGEGKSMLENEGTPQEVRNNLTDQFEKAKSVLGEFGAQMFEVSKEYVVNPVIIPSEEELTLIIPNFYKNKSGTAAELNAHITSELIDWADGRSATVDSKKPYFGQLNSLSIKTERGSVYKLVDRVKKIIEKDVPSAVTDRNLKVEVVEISKLDAIEFVPFSDQLNEILDSVDEGKSIRQKKSEYDINNTLSNAEFAELWAKYDQKHFEGTETAQVYKMKAGTEAKHGRLVAETVDGELRVSKDDTKNFFKQSDVTFRLRKEKSEGNVQLSIDYASELMKATGTKKGDLEELARLGKIDLGDEGYVNTGSLVKFVRSHKYTDGSWNEIPNYQSRIKRNRKPKSEKKRTRKTRSDKGSYRKTISQADAADLLGVKPQTVGYHIHKSGKIQADEHNRPYKASVLEYKKSIE